MTLRGCVLQLPELNTVPYNYVRENSVQLSGYDIGFSFGGPWFKSCPNLIFLLCIDSFVSLLRTLFVRIHLKYNLYSETTQGK